MQHYIRDYERMRILRTMIYHILIADDEQEIRELLKIYLEKDNYIVDEASDGLMASVMIEEKEYDLLILDIMMPKLDGFRLLKKIRENKNIPVMILSAKIQDSDKILGLELGADDYISKPFNPLEVCARVKSNLRRYHSLGSKITEEENLTIRDLHLDRNACQLQKNGENIELTSVEYRLMELFMKNPGKVFTKQQLFSTGWGEYEFLGADNNIMVCISKLRAKLEDDKNDYIKTVRGLGYRMEK